MIPSPFVIVCMVRAVYRTISFCHLASGHSFVRVPPHKDQPDRTHILRCVTCDKVKVAWQDLEGNLYL